MFLPSATMTTEPTSRSTRTTRILRAGAPAVYAAFLDPDALVAWLPPPGMTGRMHAFDARAGGGYEMSLCYATDGGGARGKTTEREDRVVVRFVALVPPSRSGEAVRFVSDDPAFGGEMTLTVSLEPAAEGLAVTRAFDEIPPGVRPEDNDAGARASLAQLARHVERPDARG